MTLRSLHHGHYGRLLGSAIIGTGFVLTLAAPGRERTGGVARTVPWWILGPLTLMPHPMGMGLGANWTAAAMVAAMPGLMGHLVFGGVPGLTYHWLETRTGAAAAFIQQPSRG